MSNNSNEKEMAVRVECYPEEALIDQVISIQVLNLLPFTSVTISAWIEQNGKHFGSYSHYTVSEHGDVDLSKECAEPSGLYVGVESMGLFWSMVSVPGQRTGERLYQSEASEPLAFEIRVYDGHLCWDELWVKYEERGVIKAGCSEENLLAKKVVLRSYKAPDVSRIVVETGRIRGTLFIPAGLRDGETRPGVIDMFGSRGGLLEMRAALLASHGFVAMALGYFYYKDLPTELRFEYEYFEEAAHWLQSQPNVAPGGIGMVGVSLGAQITLYMGLNCPIVKSAVGIGHPPTFGTGTKFTRAGQLVPCLNLQCISIVIQNDGMRSMQVEYDLEKYFTFNTSHTPSLLIILGAEDTMVKGSDVTKWLDTLSDADRSMVEVAVYEGAGHLIEPPHAPLCSATYHKWLKGVAYYGGTPKLHAVAQEESWKRIRDFLWNTLGKGYTKSRL
ncbi:acyl-coenzyme A amino acid N-acyltransferase 1 [Octopus bimaculoides]|uniref:Acyl-CoA thioester hydrolase/bile acid-CoA amino acid N-acetyltransferase domain-containing protein n=1 Tax=Octopus bimaculoides TaxID=37653 RepID=A0A0L8FQJ8_OCTBM|nr:acyl-coenzyme A amino acid N-acyltransferase 1 [Octopus bimaculoides]|eukprot:XP_014787810.1 PREDICTED: acyl-coenzyme A amino acid N-acyltransferase 1-like [Octopus bimaculoides]